METIPRRIAIDQFVPAELSIRASIAAVEDMPPHPWLTDAVVLLTQAKEKVADFIDHQRANT